MDAEKGNSPLIFNIARGSFVDGPGIRTVVFFKGCPLACLWCQNPESQELTPETFYYPDRCIHCGRCAQGCDTLARQNVGTYYHPDELTRLLLGDKIFYHTSGGGVTYSGGEPLLFIDYIAQTAGLLAAQGVHQLVETCGYFDFTSLVELLPLIDLFYFDIKLMDPEKHRLATGKSNQLILANFKKLLSAGVNVLPRVPLIPGFTATHENLTAIARFLLDNGVYEYQLLPFNPTGDTKRERLGKEKNNLHSQKPFTMAEEQYWFDFFKGLMARN